MYQVFPRNKSVQLDFKQKLKTQKKIHIYKMSFRNRLRSFRNRFRRTPTLPPLRISESRRGSENSELGQEQKQHPFSWENNLSAFIKYIQFPRQEAFIQRVFKEGVISLTLYFFDYTASGYESYNFTQKLLYIHEMMMVGIMYMWTNELEISKMNFPKETKEYAASTFLGNSNIESYVDEFFHELSYRIIITSPEQFLEFFHRFLHFYQSIRAQTKQSIFQEIDLGEGSLHQRWKFVMDLFWMLCLYTYPSVDTDSFSVMEWIRSLYYEEPFLLVLYLNIILFSKHHNYLFYNDELDRMEDVLSFLVEQKNGYTGFEQMISGLSSLETRLKDQFPKEQKTADIFDTNFIKQIMEEVRPSPDEGIETWSVFRVSQSPTQWQSLSPSREEIKELSLHPNRVGHTDMMDAFVSVPVSDEELVHYGLVAAKNGDVFKLVRDEYGELKRVRVNRPVNVIPADQNSSRSPSSSPRGSLYGL